MIPASAAEDPWIPAARQAEGRPNRDAADRSPDGVFPGDPAPIQCGDCDAELRFQRFGPAVVLICPECVAIRRRVR